MMDVAEQEFVNVLRDRLTAHVESQPEVLLEHDGGPMGLKADLYLATLYGMDGQVDAEWRIPKVEPYLLRPVRPRMSAAFDPEPEPIMPMLRTARYELQSNWATMQVDWLHFHKMLPIDIRPDPGTYLITVALLRYRHRL